MAAGEAAWESMSMRQLRTECKERGIDVAGCFEKPEFIRRLRTYEGLSADGGKAGSDSPGQALDTAEAVAAAGGAPDAAAATGPRGAPGGAVGGGEGGADAWSGMPVRELRRQAALLGADLSGCSDKAEMAERVRVRATAAAAAAGDARCTDDRGDGTGMPVASKPDREHEESTTQRASEAAATNGSAQSAGTGLGAGPPAAAVAHDGRPWEAMSVRELRKECQLRGIDVAGVFDKGTFITRLQASSSKGGALPNGKDSAPLEVPPGARTADPDTETAEAGAASGAPAAAPTPEAGLEAGARQSGGDGMVSGRLADGRPWEAVSVRQLRQECQALGVDIAGCYAKSEMISRLRAHQAAGQLGAGGATGTSDGQPPTDQPPTQTDSRFKDDGLTGAEMAQPHREAVLEAPLPTVKSAGGSDEGLKRWEVMSMRQLRKECEDQGIDLTGCYAKAEVIRKLQAGAPADASAVQQRQQVANPNEPDVQEVAEPPAASPETEIWQSMTMRELRAECELHGVDPLSCHDKADIVRQLSESRAAAQQSWPGRAVRVGVADKASQSEAEPPLEAAAGRGTAAAGIEAAGAAAVDGTHRPPAEQHSPQEAKVGGQVQGQQGEVHYAAKQGGACEVDLQCGRRVVLDAKSLGELSARELRQECDSLRVDLDGCLDKADIVRRLLAALQASADGWEACSMRQLKSECKARGIDVAACFDKAEIIGKLRAAGHSPSAPAAPTPTRPPVSEPSPDAKAPGPTPTAARARLSIADLHKWSADDLRHRCLKEGLAVNGEERRGALIARLRQKHPRAVGFGASAAPQLAREKRPLGGKGPPAAAKAPASAAAEQAAAKQAPLTPKKAPPPPADESSCKFVREVKTSPRGGAFTADAQPKPEAAASEQPVEQPPREDTASAAGGPAPAANAGADTSSQAAQQLDQKNSSFFDFDDLPDDTTGSHGRDRASSPRKPAEANKAAAPEASPPPAAAQEEDWESKPTSELRRVCQRRGIDLTGCFQKEEYISRLRAAAQPGTGAAAPSAGSEPQRERGSAASEPARGAEAGQRAQADLGSQASQASSAASAASAAPSVEQGKAAGSSSAPTVDTEATPISPPAAPSSTPTGYGAHSVKELLKMAKEKGIDVSGCCEKADIIERLQRGPIKATPLMKTQAQGAAARRAKSASASSSRTYSANGAKASNAPSRSSASSTSGERESFPGWKAASGPPPAKAPASPADHSPSKDEHRSPSCSLSWSGRVRRFFDCYPGFSAILPPEAETWTDQQLEVYFGSNGEIWPAGRRPAWMGRPFEDQEPQPQVPKKKQYPDLKVHFETLDLAETTPPDMIRRHYRRLARDNHPDKNSDDPEGAAERFRKIQTAYEAIRDRLHL